MFPVGAGFLRVGYYERILHNYDGKNQTPPPFSDGTSTGAPPDVSRKKLFFVK
jgi:hypothetical protein